MPDNLSLLQSPIFLSGLPFGPDSGLGGLQQPGVGGPGTGGAATPFGMPGGPGLDLLTLLQQFNAGDQSPANFTGLQTPIGQGGLGASQLGQQISAGTPGGFGMAGQTASGASPGAPGGAQTGQVAGQTGGASPDPLSIIAKLLGLGSQINTLAQGGQQQRGQDSTGQTGLPSPIGFQPIGNQAIPGVAPAFEDPFNPTLPSGDMTTQDALTAARAEMGPTGAEGGSGFGMGGQGIPGLGGLGTGLGLAGSGLGVAGLLSGNQDLTTAGRAVGTAGSVAGSLSGAGNALSQVGDLGIAGVGFGLPLGAANQDLSQYIGERLGGPTGAISNIAGDIGNLIFPGMGSFAEGLTGAIASAFSAPVYAQHRQDAGQSIKGLMPIIQAALPQVRSPEDFAELQRVINSQADRWSLTPEGITGGYDVGGNVGSRFNPGFQQALAGAESRPDQPGAFDAWLRNWALNQAVTGASLGNTDQQNPGGTWGSVDLGLLGSRTMAPLGLSPQDAFNYAAQQGIQLPQPIQDWRLQGPGADSEMANYL